MREDCRHYDTRTYNTGDVVRRCKLDLAPEAPWSCPSDCKGYERRVSGAGWVMGSLAPTAKPETPPDLDPSIAALLDEAEAIVNNAAPEVIDKVNREEKNRKTKEKKRRKKRGRT